MLKTLSVRSHDRCQMIDITREVAAAIRESGVSDGVATVFAAHTTAGVTINENADPDVTRDILDKLARLFPPDDGYRHAEGNSDAHIKSSFMGSSLQVIVHDGRPLLGTWQGIYFCEFDGPRSRVCHIDVRGNEGK
jgi:secondary thiamine-phosphate synthase enzyme